MIQRLNEGQISFTARFWDIQLLFYWERLQNLNHMCLQRRWERFVILQMWKILHQHCPNDIQVRFTNNGRRGIQADVPPLNRNSASRHQSSYDNSFSVLGPRLWNLLPSELTELSGKETFKSRLTKHLCSFPDEPTVRGSDCNSLLEWCLSMADSRLSGRSGHLMTQ